MKVLITGGLGFIGANAAARYLKQGAEVVILDNCVRPGVIHNRKWLESQKGKVKFENVDIVGHASVLKIFNRHRDADLILHLASQVAVTTSVSDPRKDFEVNALGTFNILEAMRLNQMKGTLIYASTNKVYGGMEDIAVIERDGQYAYRDYPHGIPETRTLDFHSPYGCSKGAADQYVRDYHRIYGLKTIVFRQSCIYGYRQFGMEDQGWIAWLMIRAQSGKPFTVYGDGKQVRDVLFIDDLLDAYDQAYRRIKKTSGEIYNMGGGAANSLSIAGLIWFIEKAKGKKPAHTYSDWRPGDQRVYISDIRKAQSDFGWSPKIGCAEGLNKIYDWIHENIDLFKN